MEYTSHDGEDTLLNVLMFNSVLLVKDFDATGFTTDTTFTTNADVPAMATEGLIENAANPFTGTKLQTYEENPTDINVLYSREWHVQKNNGTKFVPGEWFNVTGDNPFDVKNWKYIGWE